MNGSRAGSLEYCRKAGMGLVSRPNNLTSFSALISPRATASSRMLLLYPIRRPSADSWKSPTAPTTAIAERSWFWGFIFFATMYVTPEAETSVEPSMRKRWGLTCPSL